MIGHYTILRSFHPNLIEALDEILHEIQQISNPLRFVFFADIISDDNYESIARVCDERISRLNLPIIPIVSWISQPPLGGVSLYCEVTYWKGVKPIVENRFFHNEIGCDLLSILVDSLRYTLIHADSRGLSSQSIFQKANQCFQSIDRGVTLGKIDPAHIVRQWNYIEKIVDFDDHKQHYQMFNDSRSDYYDRIDWKYGYPSATGIGMQSGGVVIDLDFFESNDIVIKPIDNQMQKAAHCYSEELLLGLGSSDRQKTKSTPKFERAKWVKCSVGEQLFISGTAAIRGEESCNVGVSEQTVLTIENIIFLKKSIGYLSEKESVYRIYVKKGDDYSKVISMFHHLTQSSVFIIVEADVCRQELFVEIEALF